MGCLGITWPYAPPHLGIAGTEEILATFSGELADRHPPTEPTQDRDCGSGCNVEQVLLKRLPGMSARDPGQG